MKPQDLAAKVGDHLGSSEWAEMSQERINQFADATGITNSFMSMRRQPK